MTDTRFASYDSRDQGIPNGGPVDLEGTSLEDLQAQLPDDFRGRLEVRDEAGFVRGWIGEGGFRAS